MLQDCETIVEDSHAVIESLNREFFFRVFADGVGEACGGKGVGGDGNGFGGVRASLRLREEGREFARDGSPAVFFDGGVAHIEEWIVVLGSCGRGWTVYSKV